MSATPPQNIPGLTRPTQIGMLSGNPKDSAAQSLTNMNQKQAALSKASGAVGGGKNKKGGVNPPTPATAAPIPITTYKMGYSVQNGPEQSPNAQIAQTSITGTQGAANRVNDSQASNMSGGRKYKKSCKSKKGGNPNWHWGCYSGGKKHKQQIKNVTKKYRKKGGGKTTSSYVPVSLQYGNSNVLCDVCKNNKYTELTGAFEKSKARQGVGQFFFGQAAEVFDNTSILLYFCTTCGLCKVIRNEKDLKIIATPISNA